MKNFISGHATRICSLTSIDLLLTDVKMPRMDGLALWSNQFAIKRENRFNKLGVHRFVQAVCEALSQINAERYASADS